MLVQHALNGPPTHMTRNLFQNILMISKILSLRRVCFASVCLLVKLVKNSWADCHRLGCYLQQH